MDAFNSPTISSSIVYSIMDDYRHMATRIPQKMFRHIYREANRCADFLARIDTLLENNFISFSSPPVDLVSMLEADASSLYVNRLCPETLLAV